MALIYKMRAIAVSDSDYVFWTDTAPDVLGTNAPEPVVLESISVDAIGGSSVSIGQALPHDTTHSPVGLWQFNGDYTDSSGNGLTLANSVGSISYYPEILPGLKGAYFDGGTRLHRAVHDASLTITGPVTIELITMTLSTGTAAGWLGFGLNLETLATNVLYQFQHTADSYYFFFSETGTGTNQSVNTGINVYNNIKHLCCVRESDDSISVYENGLPVFNGGSAPSAGGTSARLFVGANGFDTSYIRGVISSLKIINGALSANDVKAEYNRTLGPALGEI